MYKKGLTDILAGRISEKHKDDKGADIVSQCKDMLDLLIKVTQDTKNDKAVAESGIIKIAFQLLASLYQPFLVLVESSSKKLPSFERKNSLRK